MITIEETLYKQMPEDIQSCFSRLPNDGSEEVEELFPYTKTGNTNAIPYTNTKGKNVYGKQTGTKKVMKGDSGSASRFFYCAKASKKDRNEGCEGLEGKTGSVSSMTSRGERERGESRNDTVTKNNHPTVKPTKLMQYLVRLVTPPNGICLDPFMGSGSTGKACKKEHFDFIGIELDPEYLEIAKARIENLPNTLF